jgi:hypothetical protein
MERSKDADIPSKLSATILEETETPKRPLITTNMVNAEDISLSNSDKYKEPMTL